MFSLWVRSLFKFGLNGLTLPPNGLKLFSTMLIHTCARVFLGNSISITLTLTHFNKCATDMICAVLGELGIPQCIVPQPETAA